MNDDVVPVLGSEDFGQLIFRNADIHTLLAGMAKYLREHHIDVIDIRVADEIDDDLVPPHWKAVVFYFAGVTRS